MASKSQQRSRDKNGIAGYSTCPTWLRTAYRIAANYTCTMCRKHEDIVGQLQPHRITRKTHGGLYTVCPIDRKGSNVKPVCSGCHQKIHANEFNKTSHTY